MQKYYLFSSLFLKAKKLKKKIVVFHKKPTRFAAVCIAFYFLEYLNLCFTKNFSAIRFFTWNAYSFYKNYFYF